MRYFIFFAMLITTIQAQAADIYLFYNSDSRFLSEIDISKSEVRNIFDGEFGPASDELPQQVKYSDFYVSKYPDGSYVFVLNSPFNCGQLGCNTIVFAKDDDGTFIEQDDFPPVKCTKHDIDKLLCTKGGYKPKVDKKQQSPKKILHFYAPQQNTK